MNVPASSSSILSISSCSGRNSRTISIRSKKSSYIIVFTFLLVAVSASSTTTSAFTSSTTMLMTRAFARDASSLTAFAPRRVRTATMSSPTTTTTTMSSSSFCNTANFSNDALVGTIASTPCRPPPRSGTPRFAPFSSVGRFRQRGCIPRQFHTRYPVHDWHDETEAKTQTMLTMASTDSDTESDTDSDTETQPTKTIDSKWNVPALKKEAARQTLRCHKKIGKASLRLQQCSDDDNDEEQLQQEQQLEMLRTRLAKLNTLEENLSSLPSKRNVGVVLPEDVAKLVLELDVREEPVRQARNTKKKKKGPSEKQVQRRKPYRKYFALDQTEIRVGKRAEDNDELSCNPLHRDGSDWWMHASGCPGSHVVIRSNSSGNLSEEVVMDAAALAARQSKCTGGTIRVSMTKCRNISKPPGAKPGLVRLNGDVRTVVVNMKAVEERLKRLDDTCLVN